MEVFAEEGHPIHPEGGGRVGVMVGNTPKRGSPFPCDLKYLGLLKLDHEERPSRRTNSMNKGEKVRQQSVEVPARMGRRMRGGG